MAQSIRLHQPACGPRFESKAFSLIRFLLYNSTTSICHKKEGKSKHLKKEAEVGPNEKLNLDQSYKDFTIVSYDSRVII